MVVTKNDLNDLNKNGYGNFYDLSVYFHLSSDWVVPGGTSLTKIRLWMIHYLEGEIIFLLYWSNLYQRDMIGVYFSSGQDANVFTLKWGEIA